MRLIKKLRDENPNWTIKRMMEQMDITDISVRTFRRFLTRNGYRYLQARKKGLLSDSDKRKRVDFAKLMMRNYPADIWREGIAFYLDGVGFVHKRNPKDQAQAPKGRVWRKPSEGLIQGGIAKGSACGTGGNYVKFVVALSYEKGVICAEPYHKMDGEYFAGFLRRNFEQLIKNSGKN